MTAPSVLAPHAVPGWLADRDPRLLVVAAFAFALVTVGLSRQTALLAALGVAVYIAVAGGQQARSLIPRLVPVEGFVLLMLVTLLFTVPGDVWFEIGPLAASRDGLDRAVVIALKANAVVLVLTTLVGGMEPVAFGHALARLRVPDKLVHLLLFTVRYLSVLQQELQRLRRAMRARAFVPRNNGHTWRALGWLVGMLLVRSLERSRRVSAAMKCRGFQGQFHLLDSRTWGPADTRLAFLFGAALVGLLAMEHLA